MDPVTVADVLLNGRDVHSAFGRRWTADGPVLRFLSRYQQELLSRLAQIKRDAMQLTWQVDIPSAESWTDGEVVPARILLHGGSVFFEDTNIPEQELDICEFSQRLELRPWGVYFLGGFLRFMGSATDWTGVDHIDLYYFPQGEPLTARTDEFVLPGQCLSVLTAAAAHFLGKRAAAAGETVDVAELREEKTEAETVWLDEVTGRRRAVVSPAREVW